jgi:hypothetical protein
MSPQACVPAGSVGIGAGVGAGVGAGAGAAIGGGADPLDDGSVSSSPPPPQAASSRHRPADSAMARVPRDALFVCTIKPFSLVKAKLPDLSEKAPD